jgi:hypothetical protein
MPPRDRRLSSRPSLWASRAVIGGPNGVSTPPTVVVIYRALIMAPMASRRGLMPLGSKASDRLDSWRHSLEPVGGASQVVPPIH